MELWPQWHYWTAFKKNTHTLRCRFWANNYYNFLKKNMIDSNNFFFFKNQSKCGSFYLDDQHVNHAGVSDMLVFVEHLPHFVSALSCRDVQLKHRHCQNRNIKYVTTFPPYQLAFISFNLSFIILSKKKKAKSTSIHLSPISIQRASFQCVYCFCTWRRVYGSKAHFSQPWARRHEVIVVLRYLERQNISWLLLTDNLIVSHPTIQGKHVLCVNQSTR